MTPKPKQKVKRSENEHRTHTPRLKKRDPSLSTTIPTTSRERQSQSNQLATITNINNGREKRWFKHIYDPQENLFCDRTCSSWIAIVLYSILYFIFLSTYTLIFLYASLSLVKSMGSYLQVDKLELLTYAENGIGLSATPTSETSFPLIWYKENASADYERYMNALDNLLHNNRKKRDVNSYSHLGPCGNYPYGYGEKPCIIIRINKQLHWSAKPLEANCSLAGTAPMVVQRWLKLENKMLWLYCDGYHSYDKEHIGNITYFPDPPGFDPKEYPLNLADDSPLVAIQISNFTVGISLAIQCKLWYDKGPSTVEFILYVAPNRNYEEL